MMPLTFTDRTLISRDGGKEKAILVGVFLKGKINHARRQYRPIVPKDSMDELEALTKSANATVLHSVTALANHFNPSMLIGPGKAEELHLMIHEKDADMVIFNNLLRPVQQKNLEDVLGVKVIDRKELILDIFAQRAKSSEGKLQVELAQLQYRLSRIIGKGIELSRTGGGIGTRGPGEKKLEIDRRRIRERINHIKRGLIKVQKTRALHHERRKKRKNVVVSLVGYTNAGKSTLFNLLTGSSVASKNQMFSTLDPTTRKIKLPINGKRCLIVDTVGFIKDLPPELIDAFKATLEGINESDLILHIIDFSSHFFEENQQVVETILTEIGVRDKPIITVYNKLDLVPGQYPVETGGGKLYISAKAGLGTDGLIKEIVKHICQLADTGKNSTQSGFSTSQTSSLLRE
jgi:GTP-binding protein HflX